jgi:hypothetical protein
MNDAMTLDTLLASILCFRSELMRKNSRSALAQVDFGAGRSLCPQHVPRAPIRRLRYIIESTMNAVVLESVLTCPRCGFAAQETMPTDACLYFYECRECKTLLRPKPGDCCVFCSFGSVKCPPIQEQRRCCG